MMSMTSLVPVMASEKVNTNIAEGLPSLTLEYSDTPSLTLPLISIGDAKGGSFGGSRSSSFGSSRSSFGRSSSSSRSSFYGAKTAPSTSKSSVFGTSKASVVSNNGKYNTVGKVTKLPYKSGSAKIIKSTPKTYVTGHGYSRDGTYYNQVYYGSGFDLSSLILLGFILDHDDQGNVIYINNETKEIVRQEDIETTPESPGLGSVILVGILAVAFLLVRRRD